MVRAFFVLAIAFHPTLLLADVVVATQRFELRSDERSNLHHFLIAWSAADRGAWPTYALPVAERDSWRALLDDEDERAWSAAVSAYERTVRRSVIFDDGMIAVRNWAAGAAAPDTVPAADRPLLGALEAALPVYRRYWWRAHDAENRAWIESVQGVLRNVEQEMVPRLEAAYGGRWPAGKIPVDVVLYSNDVGGYTTGGRSTISSAAPGNRMPQGLEVIFHEASHFETLEPPLSNQLNEAFRGLGLTPPERFWHDMIFFTVGTVTAAVLERHGAPGYKHYGESGPYTNPRWGKQLPLLRQHWAPLVESGSATAEARQAALKAIAEGMR